MKSHTTKLIEGHFTKDKALTLLLELISHKIQFHQLQKFSSQERFGKDIDHTAKRIAELNEEKQKLIEWINSVSEEDSIEISGNIQLKAK